jgi:DNA modification methylase
MKHKIIKGDCLTKMDTIPDKSIDMILCDPPFGTTKCKWDSVLDLDKMWEQYNRIIKDDGAILLFAQTPFDKVLGSSNLKMLRYEWIWEKTQATGFLNAKKMPLKAHENILVFYKKLPTYNPIKTEGHKPMNSYTKKADVQNKTELYGKVSKDVSGGGATDRYPRSVLKFKSDKQINKNTGFIHPTQKPVPLLENLIMTYTNENDLILDNTAGSGSTGIAAYKNNRNCILMEIEDEYIDLMVKRYEYEFKVNINVE